MKLPKILYTLSKALKEKNVKTIVVGGVVRDHFLKLPSKDIDVEVYGLQTMEELEVVLSEYGSVNLVGKSFGVLKFVYEEEEYDFSFPRRESKVSQGHRGFDVEVDGSLDFKTAARRRDFTLNALGFNIEEKMFIDPFGGIEDIKQKTLRHIDEHTFVEDPLRVYRAVQFSARFGYKLDVDTFSLCKRMVEDGMLDELAKERVYEEWKKLLLKATRPSQGFELMRELGILERYFPELQSLVGVVQSPIWHPEGDVWVHTMMTLDEMVKLLDNNKKLNLKFLFSILCHDLGKATHTTVDNDGRIRAIGHEEAGIEPTKSLMYRLMDEHDFIKSLFPLVEHHLKPSQFYRDKSKASAIRRLATKVNIEELVVVAKADFLGRTTQESLVGTYYAGVWLLTRAKELKVDEKPLENLLQGRDLVNLGLEPSPEFSKVLALVYDLQLDGKMTTKQEALDYVKRNYLCLN